MKRALSFLSLFAVLALTLSATRAFAATDVTGSWTADMTSPDGNSFQLSFTFKQDGVKVTGSVQGPQGDPIEISNGKVDGDKFTFDVSFNGVTIAHEGTVSGDEIKLTTKPSDPNFPSVQLTLKRAKPAPAPAQ